MSTITAPTTERPFSGLAAPSVAAPSVSAPAVAALSVSASSTPPLAAAAVIGSAVSFMLEAIVEVERLMASLMASRTVAINELYQLALVAENPDRSGFGRPWSAKIAAHRVASSELAAATRISEREALLTPTENRTKNAN